MTESKPTRWVLQVCHGYSGPFLDCARQYAALFDSTDYRICTVYLTGEPSDAVAAGSASDEVIFLGLGGRDIRGLKFKAIREIRRIARGRQFSFCIAHRFKPTYIALFATGIPVIGVQHAFGVYDRVSRRLLASTFRSRLMLLGVSQAVARDIAESMPRFQADRIETLYNRIDVAAVRSELLPKSEARKELGLDSSTYVIGNVGRLHPDKDQATLIEAFAEALPQLPSDSRLFIAGTGPLEQSLKKLAATLGVGDKVSFPGQVPNARTKFRAFDSFALSSDHEPFGMVLLEAMAAGLPIICSDCGGGREVVAGEGRLFPLGDSRALAAQLVATSRTSAAVDYPRLQTEFSDAAAKARFWSLAERWALELR
ncbi:Glycosyltransferase involved in cell wall bisynthesis [Halopseudomonas xinjiangensis]|uniref:Glycosyltransferase involved in cell wall bisynthesis n=1 Tax=Halopseudomonas xinjiangensis TaxID=487184 RepID=A0A1H1M0L3_9GAMM|nr:glycosyltransferase [Halopseudomonas xinjiangensis]SDR80190.1 Glycosyltransferase involved in cell wall bisynthesis [Halopseudomonas xinjiangensis]